MQFVCAGVNRSRPRERRTVVERQGRVPLDTETAREGETDPNARSHRRPECALTGAAGGGAGRGTARPSRRRSYWVCRRVGRSRR